MNKRPGGYESRSGKRGVTLLETILTISILALLAGMAVPQWQEKISQKRADSAISTLRSIASCIQQYRIDHDDTWPADTRFSALETTSGNGCLDRSLFEPTYTFPDSSIAIGTIIGATDKKSSRYVCGEPVLALDESPTFYEYSSTQGGACKYGAGTSRSRTFPPAVNITGDY